MNIPISRTVFSPEDLSNIVKPLESGWVVQGPYVAEFEKRWCDFTGSAHSVAVSNCTTALHLSLAATGIGPGDEVIVPAFTWIATANAVEAVGARPVFCDIDLRTFNLDPANLEQRVTSKTRAIIPVHLFGLAAPMEEVLRVARAKNLVVIEDAACGFGSTYRHQHVGNFGQTGCYSFHPRKAITTGEGGMITTSDEKLAIHLRCLRDHGAAISDFQRHHGAQPYLLPDFPYAGFNFRMTDIQASIGCSQMARASEINRNRCQWAERFHQELGPEAWLQLPFQHPDYGHGYQSFACLFCPEEANLRQVDETHQARNAFMSYLQNRGISTRPATHAVHLQKFYAEKYSLAPEDFPNAYLANHCSISFPLFTSMTAEEFDYIVTSIRSFDRVKV